MPRPKEQPFASSVISPPAVLRRKPKVKYPQVMKAARDGARRATLAGLAFFSFSVASVRNNRHVEMVADRTNAEGDEAGTHAGSQTGRTRTTSGKTARHWRSRTGRISGAVRAGPTAPRRMVT